jgi:pilus assembly protein Flp/PilA
VAAGCCQSSTSILDFVRHLSFDARRARPTFSCRIGKRLDVQVRRLIPGRIRLGFAHRSRGAQSLLQDRSIVQSIKTFLKSEDGPTAVEYAVMLALIVVVCLTAVRAVGTNTSNKFNDVKNSLT